MDLTHHQARVDTATEAFHYNLYMLLNAHGLFKVLEQHIPDNMSDFLASHQELMRMHSVVADAHREVVDAHVAMITAKLKPGEMNTPDPFEKFATAHQKVAEAHACMEGLHIPSPPKLIRQNAEGFTTPVKSRTRRELFPADLYCSESLDE
jgi:hypothetical protein